MTKGGWGAAVALSLVCATTAARAEYLTRDYFLDPPAAGLWAHADAFTLGGQASLEHRHEVDGDLTMLTTRVSGLASLGYGDVGAHADFRVALLSFGGSVGYRRTFRYYPVPDGATLTRDVRKEADDQKAYQGQGFTWGEGRARLVIPLESLWLVTNYTLRKENQPDVAFDWFHANVHDGGTLQKADATLFFRHPRFGGLGPTVRWMSLPKGGGKRESELGFGLTFGTRPGFKRGADLLLFQFLTVPNDDEFGFHVLRAPVYAMLIYRASFGLWRPERR